MTKKVDLNRRNQGMNWITQRRRLAIYLRDRFTCLCCGADLTNRPAGGITLDHLKPSSKGKANNKTSNLVTMCRSCNSSRQDKPWRHYYPLEGIARVRNATRRKLNMKLADSLLAKKGIKHGKDCV